MKENIVDVFDSWIQSRLRDVHTCLPGQIEKYDSDKRKARVKILVRLRTVKDTTLEIPPIDNVPVIFPSSGSFSLTFKLQKGDGCLILFSEEGIGSFLKGKTEVNADSLAKFSLTDAICIPGLWSFPNVPISTTQTTIDVETDDKMTIKTKSGGTIEIDGNNVNINNGTKGVARKDDGTLIDSATDSAFMNYLTTHTHLGVTPGGGATGPPASSPTSVTGKIDEASDSVKAGD